MFPPPSHAHISLVISPFLWPKHHSVPPFPFIVSKPFVTQKKKTLIITVNCSTILPRRGQSTSTHCVGSLTTILGADLSTSTNIETLGVADRKVEQMQSSDSHANGPWDLKRASKGTRWTMAGAFISEGMSFFKKNARF